MSHINTETHWPVENINHLWASLVIDELIKQKITQFYIAPGMRNAPLIAALISAKKSTLADFEIVIDERAMAFRALGYSKASGKPSVIICTSGTALANFLPAVIEAKKSQIPLVILSADRPPELINSDDNQTIEQTFFYRPWVQQDLNLGAPTEDISPRALATSVSQVVFRSLFPVNGPVHINMMFREPLGYIETGISTKYLEAAKMLLSAKGAATEYQIPNLLLNSEALANIIDDINRSKKGLLVIGALPNTIDKELLQQFISKCNFSFFLEVGSSLKYHYTLNDHGIPTFDHPEVQETLKKDPPDLIIHLGGRLTSKFYYQFLGNNPDLNLYVLNATEEKEDPTHLVKKRFVIDLNSTIKQLNENINSEKKRYWKFNLEEFTKKKIQFLETAPLSFPVISKTIIDTMPDNLQFYLGNSTAIRTFDSYFSFDIKKNYQIFTNRGVSGIEGFIASALGAVDATKKDVYLVFGDVSFLHDFNSLFMLKNPSLAYVKIILINNGGGAIFTLLPINKDKEILDIITSPHSYSFKAIKELNPHLHYQHIKHRDELVHAINQLVNHQGHGVLEIELKDDENLKVYNELKTIR